MSREPANDLVALADLDARIPTERLELWPLGREHAVDLSSVLSDASLYEYTHDVPPASLSDLRATYAYLETRRSPDGTELWLNWVLRERATGMTIGYVQATVSSRHADLAWVVGTPWQRRGYAAEAAHALVQWLQSAGIKVCRAKIHPAHTASQRVAASAGLVRTHETVDGEDVWVRRI